MNPYHIQSRAIVVLIESNLSSLYVGLGPHTSMQPDWWLPPTEIDQGEFRRCQWWTIRKASVGRLARDPYGNVLMAFTSEVRAKHPLEVELIRIPTKPGSPLPSTDRNGRLQSGGSNWGKLLNTHNHHKKTRVIWPGAWCHSRNTPCTCLAYQRNWTVHNCKRSTNQGADMLGHQQIPEGVGEMENLPIEIPKVVEEERRYAASYTRSFLVIQWVVGTNNNRALIYRTGGERQNKDWENIAL